MRLAVHPTAVSSAVAIALAIAAPAASAGLELNHGPNLSSQATSATASVRSHPDDQTALPRGVRVPQSSRGLRPSDLAALDRAQAREEKALAANLAPPTRFANAPRPATIAAPSLPVASGSFDWGDGAIGAGVAGLIVLLLTAGHRAVRQRRRPATPN